MKKRRKTRLLLIILVGELSLLDDERILLLIDIRSVESQTRQIEA